MITKVVSWVGAGLLTSVMAFAGHASAAQSAAGEWQPAHDEFACRYARLASSWNRLEDRMAALSHRVAAKYDRLFQDPAPVVASEDDEHNGTFSVNFQDTGWLGIRMEEVSAEKAKELKLPAERGVLVTRVADDSPAAKAGLKVNDVITEFDGQRVEGTTALQRMVREVPPGRSISLTVWRDGSAQTLRAELSERHGRFRTDGENHVFVAGPHDWDFNFEMPDMPEPPPMPAIPAIRIGPMAGFRAFGAPMLGIDAEDLSGQLGNYFGAPDGEGILIREVLPGTPADKAGLKAGDVIVRIDGNRVRNADDLRSALRDKTGKAAGGADSEKQAPVTADLTVLRGGKQITARVELQPPARRFHPVRRVAV